jgi:hypothetical protein
MWQTRYKYWWIWRSCFLDSCHFRTSHKKEPFWKFNFNILYTKHFHIVNWTITLFLLINHSRVFLSARQNRMSNLWVWQKYTVTRHKFNFCQNQSGKLWFRETHCQTVISRNNFSISRLPYIRTSMRLLLSTYFIFRVYKHFFM